MAASKQTSGSTRALLPAAQTAVGILLAVSWLLFLYAVSRRIVYPFELDWIEGELLCHVIRLLDGRGIYMPPSTEFIPEIYPPFYYLIAAAACKIWGTTFFSLRLVSVIACFGILYLLYRIPVRESGKRWIGLVCCSFFVSCYHIHGPWFDLGRVDMLFFLLLLSGSYVLAYDKNRAWGIPGASVLLVLACYTKQTGLIFLPAAAAYLFVSDKKKCLAFVWQVGLLLTLFFVVLNVASDGWFATYTLLNPMGYSDRLAASMPNIYQALMKDVERRLITEMRFELFYKLPIFNTLALGFLLFQAVSQKKLSGVSIWDLTALAAILSYFIVRPHMGSEKNDLIYITLWGTVLLGRFLIRMTAAARDDRGRSLLTAVYLLLALQLGLLLYNPRRDLPAPGSEDKGREFIERVRGIQGEVYIPYHSMYGVMAGKKMLMNAGAFWGYQILSPEGYTPVDLIEKINRKYFSAIIIDEKSYYTHLGQRVVFDNVRLLLAAGEPLSDAIDRNYSVVSRIPYRNDDEFRNPTGFVTRPELILLPRSAGGK